MNSVSSPWKYFVTTSWSKQTQGQHKDDDISLQWRTSSAFARPTSHSKKLKSFMIEDILKEDDKEIRETFSNQLLPARPSWLLYHRAAIYPMELRYNILPHPVAQESLPGSTAKRTTDDSNSVPNYLRKLLDESRKHRRNRTVFSRFQMQKMEEKFVHKKYLSTKDRNDFAKSLCLTSLQLKTWYQNRRMKWKKEMLKIDPTAVTTRSKGRPRKDEF